MKKIFVLISALTISISYAQTGINTLSPSATLDIVNINESSKILEVNASSSSEVLTILKNGTIGVNNIAPNVNVDMSFPTSIASTNYKPISIGSQTNTITGLYAYQNLSAESSTNTSNTQALFQSNFSYPTASKTNNVLSVDAIVNKIYAGNKTLTTSVENLYSGTNTGALTALKGDIYNQTSVETASTLYGLQTNVNNYTRVIATMSASKLPTGGMYGIDASLNNFNTSSNIPVTTNIYANITNNGTIDNYKGIFIKTNDSGSYSTQSTGLYIDFGATKPITTYHKKPYSILSISDIPMWHVGKGCFGNVSPYSSTPTPAKLYTTSFAVNISFVDSNGIIMDNDPYKYHTVVVKSSNTNGDSFVELGDPSKNKGRQISVIVTDNDYLYTIKTPSNLIYHIKNNDYIGESDYYLQVGSRSYTCDGTNWYVTSSIIDSTKPVNGNIPSPSDN